MGRERVERHTETRGEIQRQLHIHYLIMSWQSYVDDQLISTKLIKDAVIAGHDGNIWASSAGFSVTAAELKVILDRYTNTEQMAMNGLMVGGTKYMFLSANDRVIRGKRTGGGALHQNSASPDCVCVRGARGPRAGGHSDGETGRVSHLGGILTPATPGLWLKGCSRDTAVSAVCSQSRNIFYVFQKYLDHTNARRLFKCYFITR